MLDAVRETGSRRPVRSPSPEWLRFSEDAGATYRVTLPLRPEVKLGAYTDYPVRDHHRRDQ